MRSTLTGSGSTGRRITVAGRVLLLLLAGCTGGAQQDPPFRAVFRPAPCPDDVAGVILLPVSCGHLTVLEDRSKPHGRTIRLFVTRILPPEGASPEPDPMLILGTDLSVTSDYAGIAPMAQRINREVLVLDQRGTAHSQPNLRCAEVDELAVPSLAVPTDDPGMRATFLDAVGACHDRLADQGIDLSAYNLQESAADAEDLRIALGIETWGITTFGTTSRVALEVVRRYPGHLREVVLDSPDLPQLDPFTESIDGTRHAIGEMAEACVADPECNRNFPELESAVVEALAELSTRPVSVRVPDDAGGDPVDILVDGSMFLRGLRAVLSQAGHTNFAGAVPAIVYGALDGATEVWGRTFAATFVAGPTYCAGYLPKCGTSGSHVLAHGAHFSVQCHDIVPFVDRDQLTDRARGEAAYVVAFAESPWLDVCDRWPVGEGDSAVAEPVSSDVPVLVLVGRFDPFAAPPFAEDAARAFTQARVVEVPIGGHNVLGVDECVREIRNAWVDEPTSAPSTACLSDLQMTFQTDLG